MTPEQIKLVQDSFARVAPNAERAGNLFYGRLFEIAPQVRPMFPEDMSSQKMKLMDMLTTAVRHLHEVEKIMPALESLGKRHIGYGVTDAHYQPVGSALLWALEQELGPTFTPEVKEAWIETFGTLAGVMKKAAAESPTKSI